MYNTLELTLKLRNSETKEDIMEFYIDLNKFFRLGNNKLVEMKTLPINSIFFMTDNNTALFTIEKIYIRLRAHGLIPIYSKDNIDSSGLTEAENRDVIENLQALRDKIAAVSNHNIIAYALFMIMYSNSTN